MASASQDRSLFVRFRLVKAWNVCSLCIPPTTTASPSSAVVAYVAPSCITSGIVVVNPHVSQSKPTISPSLKERDHEKRYPSRLSLHQCQNDQWRHRTNALHLWCRWRSAVFGHRPLRASSLDRWRRAFDGHWRPCVKVQKEIRRFGLLSHSPSRIQKAGFLEPVFFVGFGP